MTDETRNKLMAYVVDRATESEVLAQLAEEAAELAQAALKLRRALGGPNPTRVSVEEAREALIEEAADVDLCMDLLEGGVLKGSALASAVIGDVKLRRWADALAQMEVGG